MHYMSASYLPSSRPCWYSCPLAVRDDRRVSDLCGRRRTGPIRTRRSRCRVGAERPSFDGRPRPRNVIRPTVIRRQRGSRTWTARLLSNLCRVAAGARRTNQ
jgi:hypothetical protein